MFFNLLFYILFLFFSLGQLGRISFFAQQINIYLYEGCVLLALLVLLGKYRLKPVRNSLKKFPVIYIFFFFLLVSFLLGLTIYSPLENFIGILYFFRLALYFLYFFYLSYHLTKYPDFEKKLRKIFIFFVVLTLIISFMQYLFYPNLRNLIYAGWDPHLYRLFGTFFDTSISGAIYGLIFLTLFLKGNTFSKNKWFLFCLETFYLIFVVLSFSRSLYLAFIICIVLHAVVQRWYKRLLIIFVSFVILLAIVPKPFGEGVNLRRTFSIQSRISDYQNALKIWSKSPIFGIGYNRIRYAKVKLNIIEAVGSDMTHSGASFHSSFLIILVSAGVIDLIVFILVLAKLASLSEFARFLLLFLSLLSLSDNIILHPFILFLFFTLLSLSSLSPSRRSE